MLFFWSALERSNGGELLLWMLFTWRAQSKQRQSGLLPATTAFSVEGGEAGCRLPFMFLRL
jgi:hypothetical protein